MRRLRSTSLLSCLLTALCAAASPPGDPVPRLLPFQGRLVNAAGTPVTALAFPVNFAIYDAPIGGALLYAEVQNVDVAGGIVSTEIGLVNPVDPALFTNHTELYLGLAFGADPEMVPRLQIGSAGYAMHASTALQADDVEGMDINPSSVSIGGTPLIDGTGWVGPPIPSVSAGTFGSGTSNPGTDAFVAGKGGVASGAQSAVVGGLNGEASGKHAAVVGGENGLASGLDSFVAAGLNCESSGDYTFTAGRNCIAAADYAFALGRRASALHEGSFVWSSSEGGTGSVPEFASTAIGQFLVNAPGGVGIGTANPEVPLQVVGSGTNPFDLTYSNNDMVALFRNSRQDSSTGVAIRASAGHHSTLYFAAGPSPDLSVLYDPTDDSLDFWSYNDGDNGKTRLSLRSGGVWFGGLNWSLRSTDDGDFVVRNGHPGESPEVLLRVKDSGVVVVDTLKITGGSDLVESFESSDRDLEPGSVVVIDPAREGHLAASSGAYDTKVAGVVSGAGGVKPGLHLSQEGVLEGDVQVAMTGRVYVRCSAENGAIAPGDLLTTASLAGHAMRATDPGRAFGAVIGKAMSSLEDGTGLVLVLVNLQ